MKKITSKKIVDDWRETTACKGWCKGKYTFGYLPLEALLANTSLDRNVLGRHFSWFRLGLSGAYRDVSKSPFLIVRDSSFITKCKVFRGGRRKDGLFCSTDGAPQGSRFCHFVFGVERFLISSCIKRFPAVKEQTSKSKRVIIKLPSTYR